MFIQCLRWSIAPGCLAGMLLAAALWPLRTEADDDRGLLSRAAAPLTVAPRAALADEPVAVRPATTRDALLLNVAQLEEGLERLRNHPDYTATLFRRERIRGTLRAGEEVQLKLRHNPFSVHVQWDDTGQEAAFVDGQNDGKLLVLASGWRRRLGTLKFNPRSALVMRESHYAITETGLQLLAERLLQERRADLELQAGVSSRVLDAPRGAECDCTRIIVEYAAPQPGHGYRKVVTDIDNATLLPIAVEYYGWPAGRDGADATDEATLIGHYVYRDVQFDRGLGDEDFQIVGGRTRRSASEAP